MALGVRDGKQSDGKQSDVKQSDGRKGPPGPSQSIRSALSEPSTDAQRAATLLQAVTLTDESLDVISIDKLVADALVTSSTLISSGGCDKSAAELFLAVLWRSCLEHLFAVLACLGFFIFFKFMSADA